MRNPQEPYGSENNKPQVGDTIFRLGVMSVVREVRGGDVLTIRRGHKEWTPAGRFELVMYARGEE